MVPMGVGWPDTVRASLGGVGVHLDGVDSMKQASPSPSLGVAVWTGFVQLIGLLTKELGYLTDRRLARRFSSEVNG